MRMRITVMEFKELFKGLGSPDELFKMLRADIHEQVGRYSTESLRTELTGFLGHKRLESHQKLSNHRNGSYERSIILKGIGKYTAKVPNDRLATYLTQVLPCGRMFEKGITEDLSQLFLTGISTQSLSLISRRLLGHKLSHIEISEANKDLSEAIEQQRSRDLSKEAIEFLFIDGINFKICVGDRVDRVPVLSIIGVTHNGFKTVLGIQSGDKESASSWRDFFKDLKQRGLNNYDVRLGVMDGLPGLETVFKEEFTHAKNQRYQVHVARNALAKVPKKLKKEIADEIRSIFYASSKRKPTIFSETLKKTTIGSSFGRQNFLETLWNSA